MTKIEFMKSVLEELKSIWGKAQRRFDSLEAKMDHIIDRESDFRKATDSCSYEGNYYDGDEK